MGPLQPGPGPGKVVLYFPFSIHKHGNVGKHTGPLVEQLVCAFELKSLCVTLLSCDQCRLLALHSSTGLFHVNISVPYLRPSVPPPLRPFPPPGPPLPPSVPSPLL